MLTQAAAAGLQLAGMRIVIAICWAWLSLACASHAAHPTASPTAASVHDAPSTAEDAALTAIRGVHGGAGPWVVAGYRMGQFALARLALPHGSFDLEVVHRSPREVQFSCIADGAAAATGASLGRLNLSLEPATPAETRTTYRNRQTDASVTLEITPAFAQRYANIPRAQLSAAGIEVLQLRDEEIFRESQPN
jgi:formylmethanofuran dehydrogenase subunit E